jgi:hypothetical protein
MSVEVVDMGSMFDDVGPKSLGQIELQQETVGVSAQKGGEISMQAHDHVTPSAVGETIDLAMEHVDAGPSEDIQMDDAAPTNSTPPQDIQMEDDDGAAASEAPTKSMAAEPVQNLAAEDELSEGSTAYSESASDASSADSEFAEYQALMYNWKSPFSGSEGSAASDLSDRSAASDFSDLSDLSEGSQEREDRHLRELLQQLSGFQKKTEQETQPLRGTRPAAEDCGQDQGIVRRTSSVAEEKAWEL